MFKKIFLIASVFFLTSCDELQNVVNTLPNGEGGISDAMIGNGLRQALDFGINKQVNTRDSWTIINTPILFFLHFAPRDCFYDRVFFFLKYC